MADRRRIAVGRRLLSKHRMGSWARETNRTAGDAVRTDHHSSCSQGRDIFRSSIPGSRISWNIPWARPSRPSSAPMGTLCWCSPAASIALTMRRAAEWQPIRTGACLYTISLADICGRSRSLRCQHVLRNRLRARWKVLLRLRRSGRQHPCVCSGRRLGGRRRAHCARPQCRRRH